MTSISHQFTDPFACPPWCTRDAGHDAGEPFRRHEGDLVAVPARADEGADFLAALTITRNDGPSGPGEAAVTLGDGAELDLTPGAARSLGLSLLALADRIERAPQSAARPRRYRGHLQLDRSIHDLACAWRVCTRDDDRPDLAWCAGCGCAVEIGAPGEAR